MKEVHRLAEVVSATLTLLRAQDQCPPGQGSSVLYKELFQDLEKGTGPMMLSCHNCQLPHLNRTLSIMHTYGRRVWVRFVYKAQQLQQLQHAEASIRNSCDRFVDDIPACTWASKTLPELRILGV